MLNRLRTAALTASGRLPTGASGSRPWPPAPVPKGAGPGPDLLREAFLERILANNTDLITDTAWTRLCLAGYVAFSEAIARRWLLGQASREDAQRALTDTLLRLLLETIPGH
jgi:hypothetical protein